jgi:hypothetical protein
MSIYNSIHALANDFKRNFTKAETNLVNKIGTQRIYKNDTVLMIQLKQSDTLYDQHLKLMYNIAGTVFDKSNGQLLAVLPRPLKYTYRKYKINATLDLNGYNVFPAYDGTIVTLYRLPDGSIGMATKRSPDVSEFLWNGSLTFAEMFFETAEPHGYFDGLKMVAGKLSFNLPPNHSISVGFRHKNIHPIVDQNPPIWIVQDYHLTNHKVTHRYLNLPYQIAMPKPAKVEELEQMAESYDHYGFYLESNNCELYTYNRIFIPSSLHKLLQTFYYGFINHATFLGITHKNRYLYHVLAECISMNEPGLVAFSKLSETNEKLVCECKKFLSLLTKRIRNCAIYNQISDFDHPFLVKLARDMMDNEGDVDVTSSTFCELARDYLYDMRNMKQILELIEIETE